MGVLDQYENEKEFVPAFYKMNIPEGPRIDYKQEFYGYKNGVKQVNSSKGESDPAGELARHVIAFANVARRRNQPCFIVWGINDETRTLFNIRYEYPGKKQPKGWDDPDIPIEKKQSDGVEKVFYEQLDQYIGPSVPVFEYYYGEVDGVFVSYMKILPTNCDEPFFLKKPLHKQGKLIFPKGTVFLRKNNSTLPVDDSQKVYLKDSLVYLDRQEWKRYISSYITADYLKCYQLDPFIPHRCKESDIPAEDYALDLLDSEKNVVIVGEGGIGKTVFINRLTFRIANKHIITDVTGNEEFGQSKCETQKITDIKDVECYPKYPIPIHMDLRTVFESKDDINNQLLQKFNKIVDLPRKREAKKLEKLFDIPGTQWILLFDGLDELRQNKKSTNVFSSWLKTLPTNVKTIITARHGANIPDGKMITLKLLEKNETLHYIEKFIYSRPNGKSDPQKTYENLLDWISKNDEIFELIKQFRALEGFVKAWFDFVPNLSRLDISVPEISQEIRIDDFQGGMVTSDFKVENLTDAFTLVNDEPPPSEKPFEDNDETFTSEDDESENDKEEENATINLGVTTQKIFDHLFEKESLRIDDAKNTTNFNLGCLRQCLGKISWHQQNWDSLQFTYTESIKRYYKKNFCLLSENMGLITQIEYDCFQFRENLIKCFTAAEFAERDSPNKKIENTFLQKLNYRNSKLIFRLTNELLQGNGKEPIQIPKFQEEKS
ncbi:MAG TPA: hypothetical protein VIO61_01890 [Anaerolineaceae bacterium]